MRSSEEGRDYWVELYSVSFGWIGKAVGLWGVVWQGKRQVGRPDKPGC